ncbi:hypothetical protein [Sediminibacterium ginsengisoli]|uniref:YD repeat-containing protein n=1 Tax=Sediminibacterium ginsengisoli TaxID=413434 RepID=A0A1T4L506_9BACT|nr:hypothetical protein [Sediminibacterium ginsengisoli]SJZ49802.1 hypothetical protein SAMN04488132_102307 [Sediminibacterium ginsengisoli]
MRYLLSLTAVLAVFFSSCTKDAGPVTGGDFKGKLARVKSGTDISSEYFYNTAGQLVHWISYVSTGVKSEDVTRTYSNNKLVREDRLMNYSSSLTTPQYDTSYTIFSYNNNGLLQKTDTYNRNGHVSAASNSYNAQGQLITSELTPGSNGGVGFYIRASYTYDANGNVQTEEYYNGSSAITPVTITTRTTYEYDNKANPYQHTWVMPFGVNRNNITKKTVKNFLLPGQPENVSLITYQGYNADGFPLQHTENGAVFTYEYYR